MPGKRTDQIAKMIKEMEGVAKKLRAGLRKRVRGASIQKRLKRAATNLRKHAGAITRQVERHVRELRKDLAKGGKKRTTRRPARRRKRKK